jgi:hypothetical protein
MYLFTTGTWKCYMKNSPTAMEKIPEYSISNERLPRKKKHGQTLSVWIKISGSLGENRNTREKLPLPIF